MFGCGAPRKNKRDAVATKAAIVAAALEEFAQLGLAGARIDEIARAARVNKALLYYYFESKEHLYEGVIEQMLVAMTEALRGALGTTDGPREKLLAFLDANFKVLAAQPAFARLLEQEVDIVKVFVNNLQPDTAAQIFPANHPVIDRVPGGPGRRSQNEGVQGDRCRRGIAAVAHAGTHGGERNSDGREIYFRFQESIRQKTTGGGDRLYCLRAFYGPGQRARAAQPGASQ